MTEAAKFLESQLLLVPPIYGQKKSYDPVAYIKFIHPLTQWVWYIFEYNPQKKDCYGYVTGIENEWAYFNLDDITNVHGLIDMEFKETKFSVIKESMI